MAQNTDFQTAQEAAVRLGVTVRAIQKQAAAGKIPGAERYGRAWMIPRSYDPADKAPESESNGIPDVYQISPYRQALPLLNSAYPVGRVVEYIHSIPDADDRNIALAEYSFFSGQAEKCALAAEPYLNSHDPSLRYSASLLYAFSNLSRGHTQLARHAINRLNEQVTAGFHSESPVHFHAIGILTATAVSVLLQLPTDKIPSLENYLRYLPGGMKLYACYVLAQQSYLSKDYIRCLTIAEMGLALCPQDYPIAAVYVHIAAAIALANLKRMNDAKQHINEAWKIARPDDLIEPFAEHHGLLQGLIEVYFKKNDPAAFERIIAITNAFSTSWRKIHNPETGHQVADNLTTTEFTIAMLYSRGWQAKEIAHYLQISERTVSNRIADIFTKLGVSSRTELGKFMLA